MATVLSLSFFHNNSSDFYLMLQLKHDHHDASTKRGKGESESQINFIIHHPQGEEKVSVLIRKGKTEKVVLKHCNFHHSFLDLLPHCPIETSSQEC